MRIGRTLPGVVVTVLFTQQVLAGDGPLLSLSEVLTLALANNRSIKNACDGAATARDGLAIANGEFGVHFVPQATNGLGSDTETSQSTVFNVNKKFSTGTSIDLSSGTSASDRHFYRSFTGVTVSQSLLRGFGKSTAANTIVEAKRRIGSATRQVALAKEQTLLDVFTAFYRIVGQKLLLNVWTRSFERAQQLLAASEAKMERGLATKIDIFRTQSQVAAAEGSLFEAQESLLEAQDMLKLLLNQNLREEIEVESQILPAPPALEESTLIESALHNRVEIQEAVDQVKDAERNAALAARNIYPDLRVGLNYSLTGRGPNFTDSLGFDSSRFRVLFSANIPLDLTAERAQAHQKQLEVTRKKRDLEDVQQRSIQEVRQILRHVITLEKRIDIQEKNLQATQTGLELAHFRFERGYADLLDVLRAEDSLTQAQREEISLRIERVIASLRLRKAAGLFGSFLTTLLGKEIHPQQEDCSPQAAEDMPLE